MASRHLASATHIRTPRHRNWHLGLLAATLLLADARQADAADPDTLEQRTTMTLVAGGALELVPFAVGGTMIASTGDAGVRRAGVDVVSLGFVLAPLVAHGLMDEWGRGAAFAAPPLVCGVSVAVLMQVPQGDVLGPDLGTATTRVPFWALVSAALVSSAIGLVDAAFAPARARRSLYVAPSPVRSGLAINVGGEY
jgi:hypothetical protein